MNNTQQKMNKNNSASTMAAAVTGAVVGAGIVAAGIVAMKNDDNQEKAQNIIDDVKENAAAFMKTAKEQVDDGTSKLKKTADAAEESKKDVKKIWKK